MRLFRLGDTPVAADIGACMAVIIFMGKRIVLAGIGLMGMLATLIQAHSIGFYAQRLYALTGLQTEAQEINTVSEDLFSGAHDSAREQVVMYKKKQLSSPIAIEKQGKEIKVWATAYSSHPLETDDTPFITASGSFVRDGIVATNFLPMGTKFKLPSMYGDKVFIVEDRMNARYNNVPVIDIWFASRTDAFQFGRKSLVLELL